MKGLLALALLTAARLHATAGGLMVPPPPHYDQNIGGDLAPGSVWRDEFDQPVTLASCFGRRPAIVIFGYYQCAQLCSVLQRNIIDELRELAPSVGRDYDFIYLSIDPRDTALAARGERSAAIRAYGRGWSAAGWHYLTGGPDAIRAATEAAGFNYRYVPSIRQFQHPTGFLVVTPDDRISRYFLGIDFPPAEIAAALRRAARGGVGRPVYDLILECCLGGEFTGRYGPIIWVALEVSVIATVLGLCGTIGWLLWEERRRKGAVP